MLLKIRPTVSSIPNRLLICRNGDFKSNTASFMKKKTITARDATSATITEPKPFLDIPFDGGHWITNILEVLFRHGGVHSSFYKIQQNMISLREWLTSKTALPFALNFTFRKHGSICRRTSPVGFEVFLADPADVRMAFSLEPKYPRRFNAPLFDFYERENKDPGVFFLNGEKWHKHKMLLSKKMLHPPQINAYIPRIDEVASEAIDMIKRVRNTGQKDRLWEIDDISMELSKWSFETVGDFLFDRRFNCLSENPPQKIVDFIKAVGLFLENSIKAFLLPPKIYRYIKTKAFKEFNRNFLLLYKFADELIEEKLQDIAKNSDKADSESNTGLIPFLLSSDNFKEDEIGSSIVDTLFAGVDTTSNTMQWMLYLLAKNPDVQNEIRYEILRVVPREEHLREDLLKELPLVKAAIRETLRLYPVLVQTTRILPFDCAISGYHIPKNTQINFLHHGMGRREDLFENAESFIPQRWLREDNRLGIDAFASIPFGFGVRMCLGRRLAELELQILLTKILQNFRLDISPGHVVHPCMRGANVPDKPIRVKFIDLK